MRRNYHKSSTWISGGFHFDNCLLLERKAHRTTLVGEFALNLGFKQSWLKRIRRRCDWRYELLTHSCFLISRFLKEQGTGGRKRKEKGSCLCEPLGEILLYTSLQRYLLLLCNSNSQFTRTKHKRKQRASLTAGWRSFLFFKRILISFYARNFVVLVGQVSRSRRSTLIIFFRNVSLSFNKFVIKRWDLELSDVNKRLKHENNEAPVK